METVPSPTAPPGWFTGGMAHRARLTRAARAAAGPVHAGSCAALALATALPWVWSGERGIDLYELRRVAHRLDADLDLRLLAPVAFLPLLLAASLLARWAGRRTLAWALALGAAAYTGAGAVVVHSSKLTTGSGVTVAFASAVALVATVVLEWAAGRLPSDPAPADVAPRVALQADERERSR